MKNYEIILITKNELNEKSAKEIFGDAQVLQFNSIGEKQFVYKIKKENKGFYSSVVCTINPDGLLKINKKLSLDDDVLRFLVVSHKEVKTQDAEIIKIKATEEILKPKNIKTTKIKDVEKVEQEVKKPQAKVIKIVKPEEKTKKIIKKTEPKKEVVAPEISEENRLEALDKKLDELLKE